MSDTESSRDRWKNFFRYRDYVDISQRASKYIDLLETIEADISPPSKNTEKLVFLIPGIIHLPSANAAVRLCERISKNSRNEYVFMDLAQSTLSQDEKNRITILQADLRKIPLASESIDWVIIDGVDMYMSNEDLEKMANSLRKVLKKME